MEMYKEVSNDVEVEVMPEYLDEHSEPEGQQHVWAYTINIKNLSKHTVQLLNRHWRIVDAQGKVQEVHGAGVVGEQPVLGPGDAFSYSSHTVLPTDSGFMSGTYEMVDEGGNTMKVAVPAFSLDHPDELIILN